MPARDTALRRSYRARRLDERDRDLLDVDVVDRRRDVVRLALRRRGGTLPPARRASDKPMATACRRLFTLRPLPPDRSDPRWYSPMTFDILLRVFWRDPPFADVDRARVRGVRRVRPLDVRLRVLLERLRLDERPLELRVAIWTSQAAKTPGNGCKGSAIPGRAIESPSP